MLCFLQNAHHHLNPIKLPSLKLGWPLLCFSFSTNATIDSSDLFVRRLYGMTLVSQQKSSTASSSWASRPSSSKTNMRFDLPKMLSYNVPLGMLKWDEAWVKRIFCVTIELMASWRVSFDQEGAFERHWTSDSSYSNNKMRMGERKTKKPNKIKTKNINQSKSNQKSKREE